MELVNLNEDSDFRLHQDMDASMGFTFDARVVAHQISQLTVDDNDDLVSKIIDEDYEKRYSFKCSTISDIADAIIIEGKPMFLQVKDWLSVFKENLRLGNLLLLPPSKDMYLSKDTLFCLFQKLTNTSSVHTKKISNHYLKKSERYGENILILMKRS